MSHFALSDETIKEATNAFVNQQIEFRVSRNGTLCVIFTKNAGGVYPVLGAWYDGKEAWHPAAWLETGVYPSINEKMIHTGLDLSFETNTETA